MRSTFVWVCLALHNDLAKRVVLTDDANNGDKLIDVREGVNNGEWLSDHANMQWGSSLDDLSAVLFLNICNLRLSLQLFCLKQLAILHTLVVSQVSVKLASQTAQHGRAILSDTH